MHYVYLLKCYDGNLYTGCTQNIDDRVLRHSNGYVEATKNRLPVKLIHTLHSEINTKRLNLKNILNLVLVEHLRKRD